MSTFTPRKFLRSIGSRLSPKMRGTVALVIPILCTATIFSAWMITRVGAKTAEKWVDHTEQVLFESNTLLLRITSLESRIRRYAIAGQAGDLETFEQDQLEIQNMSRSVERRIQDNPAQQRDWHRIQVLINRRLNLLEMLLEQFQLSLLPSGLSVSPTTFQQGQMTMEALRQSLQDFQNEERRLLDQRRQRLSRILRASTVIGWSLLIGSLLSSCGAVYLFRMLDTERTERDFELGQSQLLVKALASSVVDGVIMVKGLNQVEDFNRSALEMFDYQVHEIQNQPLQKFLTSIPPNVLGSDAVDENSQRIFETTGVRSNGETFPIEASLNQIESHQRQLLIVRDISERQRAQKKLETYSHELETLNLALSLSNQTLSHRNQELDQFAYLASHDLRAPLRAITSLSGWIEEDLQEKLSDESRDQFKLLRERARRLEGLIDGLAFYAQIGQSPIILERVDAKALVQQILVDQEIPAHIQVQVSPNLPVIQAHKDYLKQVFLQLINNAVKFHQGETGIIQIEAEAVNDGWRFSVIDNGPGIDPAFHRKIFEVFQTLVPRDQFESKGLGLAIVTKILMTVGGEIHVVSSLGQGSSFQFTWPKPSSHA